LPSEINISLSKARLQNAEEKIRFANQIMEIGDYKTVANRAYYAVFSAMRAVLALDGFDSKKHSGIIGEFRKSYIKTGCFPAEMSDIIDSLFSVRQSSDYDDFYLISREEVTDQLEKSKYFVSKIKEYLNTIY